MNKYFFLIGCFVLVGCSGIRPKFNDDTQQVFFSKPNGTVLTMEDHGKVGDEKITVKRSMSPLKITLKKEGFKDKEIEISSHFTDDRWGEFYIPAWLSRDSKEYKQPESAIYLIPPMGTIFMGKESLKDPFAMCWLPLFLVYGIADDLENLITLSWPRAIIGNPWYEYNEDINLSAEILTPTMEFEQACHQSKNNFIGNNDCISCTKNRIIYAGKEECSRCPEREWADNKCLLKCPNGFRVGKGMCISCDDRLSYETTEAECALCPNRKLVDAECRLK